MYDAAGEQVGRLLGQGHYLRLATNVLTITYDWGKQTISINGNRVDQFSNTQAHASEFIGHGVFNAAGNPQATFGQFEIDALS